MAVLHGLALVAALLPATALAQDPCEDAGNLTYNCQFDTFVEAPGGYVATGWWPFVISGHPAFDQSSESPKEPAQRIWSDGEGFVAGIYQTVDGVTPGATYQAYIGWFVFHSAGPEMGRSIGIDPTGGTDPSSPAIVWSTEVWEQKRLAPELVARAVAQADSVTVFLRVNHPRTYGADQAFLDAASLVLDASVPVLDSVPTGTPTPTDTATPTQTPAVAELLPATVTPEPTATPVAPDTEPEQTSEPTATAVDAPTFPAPTSETSEFATAAGDAVVPAAESAEPSMTEPATATVTCEAPAAPPVGTAVPPVGTAVPPVGTAVPPVGTAVPPVGTAVPPVGTTAARATSTPRGTAVVWDLRGGSTPVELDRLPLTDAAEATASKADPSREGLPLGPALVAVGLVFVFVGVAAIVRGAGGGAGAGG